MKNYNVSDSQFIKMQKIYRSKQTVYNEWVKKNKNPKIESKKNNFFKKFFKFFFGK